MGGKTQFLLCLLVAFLLVAMEVAAARMLAETSDTSSYSGGWGGPQPQSYGAVPVPTPRQP
ncbi:hypothetical protein BRADI_4g28540v3 [Brachypodium distachyon]|uniref:Uncharacterized protein n=1 Tax=Brachypodium distachyon TaxID=15368 RepID=I1IPI9_BRADI|nr:hypothetical protein BRADI_4g28540v3 [Brachypodium distachyon]